MILVDSAPPNSRLDAKNFRTRAERLSGEDARIIDSIVETEAFHRLEPEAVGRYLRISENARFFNPDRISELVMDIDREKIEKLMWVGQLMNPCLEDYYIEGQITGIRAVTLDSGTRHGQQLEWRRGPGVDICPARV